MKHQIQPIDSAILVLGFLVGCLAPVAAAEPAKNATLASVVIHNARVWTGNPEQPWADAVTVAGEKILAVGSWDELQLHAGPETRVIDARGGMVTPGWFDSHIHLLMGGEQLASVQLRDAKTPEEFTRRIGAFAKRSEPGVWITGMDWDHTLWGGDLPTRDWIDAVTPNNPVFLQRLDGHMALANSAALRAAKVDDDVKDVPGGTIVRDDSGRPTGILKDNAMNLVSRAVPAASPRQQLTALDAAMKYLAERGVTSVHHMGSWEDLAIFRQAHAAGQLRTRIYAAVPLATWERLEKEVASRGPGDEWLRIGGLKGFVDGSLGSHTAAFLAPFTDDASSTGLLVNTPDDLYAWTAGADRAGLHVMVHAIGDRAIRMQLDIYDRVAKENGPRDRRFRIEHAQHIAHEDISRFAKLGVIPSMQPYHAIDDGRWADAVIGPARSRTTYAFRSLLDANARPALGSDWPVAPATPLEGIYAATTRRTLDDKHPQGWVPEEKITVEEALRGYTTDAAYAAFEENAKGSLTPGKLADLVIVDRDLTAIDPNEIRGAKVMLTMVAGEVVFER